MMMSLIQVNMVIIVELPDNKVISNAVKGAGYASNMYHINT